MKIQILFFVALMLTRSADSKGLYSIDDHKQNCCVAQWQAVVACGETGAGKDCKDNGCGKQKCSSELSDFFACVDKDCVKQSLIVKPQESNPEPASFTASDGSVFRKSNLDVPCCATESIDSKDTSLQKLNPLVDVGGNCSGGHSLNLRLWLKKAVSSKSGICIDGALFKIDQGSQPSILNVSMESANTAPVEKVEAPTRGKTCADFCKDEQGYTVFRTKMFTPCEKRIGGCTRSYCCYKNRIIKKQKLILGEESANPALSECNSDDDCDIDNAEICHSDGFCREFSNSYCSSMNKCGLGDGDCDNDRDCQDGLICAEGLAEYHPDFAEKYKYRYGNADVCQPAPELTECTSDDDCDLDSQQWCYSDGFCRRFDYSYCTSKNKCGLGDGDCDANSHCEGDLVCGRNNLKDFHPDFLKRYPNRSGADLCMEDNRAVASTFEIHTTGLFEMQNLFVFLSGVMSFVVFRVIYDNLPSCHKKSSAELPILQEEEW